MYVEGSGNSVVIDTPAPDAPCWVGSINVVDMTKRVPETLFVCLPAMYVRCTVISYDYIDSNHNMIEIHREIGKLPDTEGEA